MRGFTFAAASSAVAGTILIIAACSSVPDVTFGDPNAPETSTSSSGGSSGSTTSSSGTPTDGPKDVVSDCKATGVEDCFDGMDNDCNGKTDCEDPACMPTTQCIDPVPVGWTLVTLAEGAQPSCGTGYDTPVDLKIVDGTGAGTCSCACAPDTGSTACSAGSFSVKVDANSCGSTAKQIPHNTNCTAIPGGNVDVPAGQAAGSAAPPPTPASCSGAVTPPGGAPTAGRTCNVIGTTQFGKGCATATQQCAPKPTGFSVCIAKLASDAGADTCPASFSKMKTAGTDAVDTRGCNTCTCETKPCNGTIELFQANDCTVGGMGKSTTGTLDTSCDAPTNKNFTATHYKSTLAAPTNGCAIASGGFNNALTGSIAWTDQRTVCCK